MASLQEIMALDGARIARLSGHGEALLWHPRDGSAPYPVQALVERRGVLPDDDGETTYRSAIVVVPNGGVTGVTATPVPGDGVELSMELGAAAVVAKFRQLLAQDAAAFTVEVSA